MPKFQPQVLSNEFTDSIKEIETSDRHYFVTGKAGTGKSTLLRLFKKMTKKKTVTVAPTGIAALNVGGQTIHSFFRFPSRPLRQQDIKRLRNRKIYELMEVLIIDEISMVRADLFDAIDKFLRLNRGCFDQPFGGVQLVLFGDLFQLPPVVASLAERELFSSHYRSPFFFDAFAFQDGFDLTLIELTEVFRQSDTGFKNILDSIRLNQLDWDVMEALNNRVDFSFEEGEAYINLCTTNAIADRINQTEINALKGIPFSYTAEISGNYAASRFPTDDILSLKPGAQVMFIRNDPEKDFVNGTIGKVSELKDNQVFIEYRDSRGVMRNEEIVKQKWELSQHLVEDSEIKTKTIGTFKQYPLKLAWAISIHKSQGKTYDRVKIHMGRGAFESGQTYVALSRCRSLEGVSLSKALKPRDIFVDERLIHFYQSVLA